MNNAGKANLGPAVWETPDDDFDSVCSVNVRGPFMCTRAAIRQMLCQSPHPCGSRGWIVNVASVVGLIAMSHGASYTTSKHAVLGLTKAAACDAAPHHIHVNAICPGYITTKLTKEVFDGAPEEKSRVGSLHPLRRQLGEPSDITGLASKSIMHLMHAKLTLLQSSWPVKKRSGSLVRSSRSTGDTRWFEG